MARNLGAAGERLRWLLRDVKPVGGRQLSEWVRVEGLDDHLPLPYMAFLAIVLGTRCKYSLWPAEKTRWAISLTYKGLPFLLEEGKFGLYLETRKSPPVPQTAIDDFLATLNRAVLATDKVMLPLLKSQLHASNVVVRNVFHKLDGRYRFFRKGAERAYASTPQAIERFTKSLERLAESKGTRGVSVDIWRPEREGFYHGSAALDAFFSRLEHVLVLLLPFTKNPSKVSLVDFISSNWTEKMKEVFDFQTDMRAKRLYDALRSVKERYRNPLSHGGFEKEGDSLLVQLPRLGLIPMRLSKFKDSIHYELFYLSEMSFRDASKIFDDVDQYLETGPTSLGWKRVRSGLDVAFDASSISKYKRAMASPRAFEKLIAETARFEDAVTNMDW